MKIFSEATDTRAVLSVKLNWNQVLCVTWNCYFFIFFCSRLFKGFYICLDLKYLRFIFRQLRHCRQCSLWTTEIFPSLIAQGNIEPFSNGSTLSLSSQHPQSWRYSTAVLQDQTGTISLSSALRPSITHRSPHGLRGGPCCDTALGTDEQIFCKCSADLHCNLLYLVDVLYVTSSILSVPGGDQTFTLRSAGRQKAACNQGQMQVNWIYPLAIWATQIFPYLYTLELRLHSLFVSHCATGMKEVFTHSDQNPSLLLIVHFYCICLYWI